MLNEILTLAASEPRQYESVLASIFKNISFKEHMTTTRMISKGTRKIIESKIDLYCPTDRLLYYNMKPGYVYPTRNNKIVQLTNKVHLYLWHYYPDYNQWIFNYMLNKEFYLVIDELNNRRTSFIFNIVKFRPIKYLKIMNMNLVGLYLNGLSAGSERICFKNVVFQ
jgi:hypothetical protein